MSSIITLFACKKQGQYLDPDITNTGVVFKANGSFNGSPILLEAGNNNYFMYTTYGFNSAGKYVLSSQLKSNNCPGGSNCPNSITINLHSYTLDTVIANFDPDNMFYNGKIFKFYYDSSVLRLNNDTNVVDVEYVDSNGISYSSYKAFPVIGQFVITGVQNFNNNAMGMKTKRLDYSFVTHVTDTIFGNNDTLNLSGTFAFAYPSP